MAVTGYSTTASNNTTLNSIPVSDATLASQVDNLIRELMADIADLVGGNVTGVTIGSFAFDNYVEGTFTPGISFGGGTTGITYTTQAGRYTRIGDVVFFNLEIVLSNKGSSTGIMRVTGLPITSSNADASAEWTFSGHMRSPNISATTKLALIPNLSANSTLISVQAQDQTDPANINEGDVTNTTEINITGWYHV